PGGSRRSGELSPETHRETDRQQRSQPWPRMNPANSAVLDAGTGRALPAPKAASAWEEAAIPQGSAVPRATAGPGSTRRGGAGRGVFPRLLSPLGRRRADPRWYQIAALSLLLAYGAFGLHLEITWAHVAAFVAAALAAQWTCTRLGELQRFDPRSALITALGL